MDAKRNIGRIQKVNHSLKYFGFRAAFISGLMMPLVQLTAYATYIGMAVLGSFMLLLGRSLSVNYKHSSNIFGKSVSQWGT